MEIPELRRRLRGAIDTARREGQERRLRTDAAARDYGAFLEQRAVPAFRSFAAALSGEGHRFGVSTPAASVRLAAEGAPDDYLEVALDTDADPPVVIGRSSRGRGRRNVTTERPLDPLTPIDALTADDVLEFLLADIVPLLER
jgi:hypothetical protein